jgi:hypothetical protein
MTRREDYAVSGGDMMLNFGAIMLAVTSAGFASYFIFVAPQVRLDTQQPAGTQVLASVNQQSSDPFITGSIDQAVGIPNKTRYSTLTKSQKANLRHYKIHSYLSDTAIIDFNDNSAIYSVAVRVGDIVPEFGRISRIENRNGNLFLVTDHGIIADEGFAKSN